MAKAYVNTPTNHQKESLNNVKCGFKECTQVRLIASQRNLYLAGAQDYMSREGGWDLKSDAPTFPNFKAMVHVCFRMWSLLSFHLKIL